MNHHIPLVNIFLESCISFDSVSQYSVTSLTTYLRARGYASVTHLSLYVMPRDSNFLPHVNYVPPHGFVLSVRSPDDYEF